MPAVPPKKMLEKILTAGTISAKEREAFEGMWDAVHRYGRLSAKQIAWIEKVYFPVANAPPSTAPVRSPKKGVVNSSSVTKPTNVRSLDHFKKVCPDASPVVRGKIAAFFASGGEVVVVKPK